jgi:pentatricopeptide repeat protein
MLIGNVVVVSVQAEGGRPNQVTFNAVISACIKCRDVDAAVLLFEEMAGAGFKGDAVSHTSLMATCVQAGRHRQAVKVALHQMKYLTLSRDIVLYCYVFGTAYLIIHDT